MSETVANRIATEKLCLARGYTWATIQDMLNLSDKQISEDKLKVEQEKGEMLAEEDILKTYDWYKELSLQVIADLAVAAAAADSTAGAVSALRSKEQVAKNIIDVAQNMGLLPKAADKTEHQGTHNVTFRVEDKTAIIDLIAKHIGGEGSGGDSGSS